MEQNIFKRILRQSHQPFSNLIKAWIDDTAGVDRGPLRQRKAKQILGLIWQNENELLPLFEKSDSFRERVTTSAANVIRSELSVLNKEVKMFGKFDPAVDLGEKKSFKVLKRMHQTPSGF